VPGVIEAKMNQFVAVKISPALSETSRVIMRYITAFNPNGQGGFSQVGDIISTGKNYSGNVSTMIEANAKHPAVVVLNFSRKSPKDPNQILERAGISLVVLAKPNVSNYPLKFDSRIYDLEISGMKVDKVYEQEDFTRNVRPANPFYAMAKDLAQRKLITEMPGTIILDSDERQPEPGKGSWFPINPDLLPGKIDVNDPSLPVLPAPLLWSHKISGIYYITTTKKNSPRMCLLDAISEYMHLLKDPRWIPFLVDQATRLEGIAMAYKVLAQMSSEALGEPMPPPNRLLIEAKKEEEERDKSKDGEIPF
jgi:hypothetical protein